MYAIIKTGGKQYKVAKDDVFEVEKLAVEPGSEVNLEEVLLVADGEKVSIGQPVVKGAKVNCEVVDQTKGKKVISFKFKRRKGYHLKKGHRQNLTQLKVKSITV